MSLAPPRANNLSRQRGPAAAPTRCRAIASAASRVPAARSASSAAASSTPRW